MHTKRRPVSNPGTARRSGTCSVSYQALNSSSKPAGQCIKTSRNPLPAIVRFPVSFASASSRLHHRAKSCYGRAQSRRNHIVEKIVTRRINRAIELLEQDQAIYYVGPHSGHVLTYAQGKEDAGTWADYINIGMEHGSFDMPGLGEYMRGLVDAGPTRSGHRTPAVNVEPPARGIDAACVRSNAWQFRQILARGVHGMILCQVESAD